MSFVSRLFGFSEFRKCDKSEQDYNYLIVKTSWNSHRTTDDLNPKYRYDKETGVCRDCEKGIADFKRDFPQSADRTSYIANTILPQVLHLMGAETARQEKDVKEKLDGIFNFDDFLARLRIVLRGISDWNEKLELLGAIHPCHTPPSDLEIINFPQIPRYTRRNVIKIGADFLPREFYINEASFKLRNPNNQTRSYILETPQEHHRRTTYFDGGGVGTFT